MKESPSVTPSDQTAEPSTFALALLNGRHIATLATHRADGSIHLAAIWYLYQDGLLYFPTSSTSQKARNVRSNSTASAMIDTRVPGQEQGVSVAGVATIIDGPRGRDLVAQAQQRYLTAKALADPTIGPAYTAFDDVVIALRPQRWTTWDIAQMNADNFAGRLSVESGYLYPYD
jgi:PPOX class probable F420-dependent enzyme